MTKIAIVILNWNGRKYLGKFLPSVIDSSKGTGVEIIIADNFSTDDSVKFLREHYPDLRLILLDKNYGFAEGYNKAFTEIEAEYFVLLNSDVEVTRGWLDPLVSAMDSDPLIAGCMPKVKMFDQKDFFEYAGAAGGYIDKYGYAFCRGRVFNSLETDYGQYDNKTEVFWTTGACMMVRGPLFKIVGGLDPTFFAHFEEIDLCWRLKNRGYKFVCVPSSVVYHVGGGTLPRSDSFKTYLNFRNNLYTLYKNLPAGQLSGTIFKRLMLDGISAFRFLVKVKFGEFFAVLKAHLHFYAGYKRYRSFRKEEKRFIIRTDHKEIYNRSIIADFFFNKRYTFHSLKWRLNK